MSFFGKIANFFKSAGVKVSAFFVAVFGSEQAQVIGDGIVALLKSALGVIVLDTVQLIELSNPMATPADKRQAAYDQIIADAKTAGLQFSTSIINLLIEAAVQRLKNNVVPLSQ